METKIVEIILKYAEEVKINGVAQDCIKWKNFEAITNELTKLFNDEQRNS